jgi:5'-nucleotidase
MALTRAMLAGRKGDFTSMCVTASKFWPLDPRPEEIDLRDIARALSMQCRWGGHVNRFYSVAQHCVSVSEHCPAHPIEGLLHDAAEAYLVDVPTPIKRHLDGYLEIERNLLGVIGERFGVWLKDLPPEVHFQDQRALATEQRDLRPKFDFWTPAEEPWFDELMPMGPCTAEKRFLERAAALGLK